MITQIYSDLYDKRHKAELNVILQACDGIEKVVAERQYEMRREAFIEGCQAISGKFGTKFCEGCPDDGLCSWTCKYVKKELNNINL